MCDIIANSLTYFGSPTHTHLYNRIVARPKTFYLNSKSVIEMRRQFRCILYALVVL